MTFLFPMRPTTPRRLPKTPSDFLLQLKFDGWNVVINEGRIWTRRGNDITDWVDDWGFELNPKYPVNGELIAVGGERKDIPSIKTGKLRPRVMAFDLMIEGMPIEERLQLLKGIEDGGLVAAMTTDPLQTKEVSWSRVNRMLGAAKAMGDEGLVLKRKGSPYHVSEVISVVTLDWLKLKVPVRESRPGVAVSTRE